MNAYARLNPDSAEANLLKQVSLNYDDILKIWSEGLVKMRREETVSVDKNSEYNKENETKYSDRDKSYLDAVNRGDMETAQRMVDEVANKSLSESKIRLPDGKLRTVYHGTNTGNFTVFNPDYIGMSSGDDGFFGMGFYFAYSPGEAKYYGAKRVISA